MKKFPAILFALCMLLALCPVSAHAEGQTIVHAGTVEELRSALADNTKIVLEGTDYSIGYLGVDGLDNVTIQGTEGTRILTEYEGNFALDIGNSDIVLEDISICLDPPEGSWHDTELFIVGLNSGSRLTLRNCRITGCLLSCAIGEGCSLTVKDTVFSGYAQGTMDMCTGEALFENCTFSGSGFGREGKKPLNHAIAWRGSWGNDGILAFVNCIFENNGNAGFMESEWETEGSYALQNCTFSNNRWGEAACPATPTSSTVLVNGEKTAFDAYSINGSNYFKLRDLAYVLSGTDKQFEVGWDAAARAISLTSGAAYTAVGGEMTGQSGGAQAAKPSAAKILLDGEEISLTAYEIGGNNYFKLRDIGQTFDFGINWDGGSRTITTDTSVPYTAE